VTAKANPCALTLTVINDITSQASPATLQQDIQALHTAIGDLVVSEVNFFLDNHTFYQGSTDQGGATLQTLDTFLHQLVALLAQQHDNDQGNDD
jgi:hypothetical protein